MTGYEELVREIEQLRQRVEALEAKEFAVMQTGDIPPVHNAAESVLYWDYSAKCLYINTDGGTTWCQIICCGGGS
jgi:hypothetical protein